MGNFKASSLLIASKTCQYRSRRIGQIGLKPCRVKATPKMIDCGRVIENAFHFVEIRNQAS